jgi:TetR/AcrR family transcriptional regulator
MDDIAREIGLNKATLYLYFKNREALFFAVVLRGAKILNTIVKEKIKNCKNGIEILDAIGTAYFEFVNEYPDYSRAYLYFRSERFYTEDGEDLCDDVKKIIELRREEFAITCSAITSGINEGIIRSDLDPVEVTVFLTLVVKSLSEMRPDFKKVLESRGIAEHQFFADVAGFVHLMLTNKEEKDAKL